LSTTSDGALSRLKFRGLNSIQVRFIMAIAVMSIVWGVSLAGISMMRAELETSLMHEQFAATRELADELDRKLRDRLDGLVGIAAQIDAGRLDDAAYLRQFLASRYVLQQAFSGGTVIVGLAGYPIADYPVVPARQGVYVGDRDYARQPIATGKTYISKPAIGRVLKRPIMSMSVPVFDRAGQVKGVLVGIIDLTGPNFLGLFGDTGYLGDTEVFLVSSDGLFIVAPDPTRVMTALPAPGTSALGDKMRSGFEGSMVADNSQGIEKLVSMKRVPTADWMLELSAPAEKVFQPVIHLRNAIVAVGLVTTVLALLFVESMWLRFLAPLRDATRRLDAMTSGRESQRKLPEAGGGEVRSLFASFNRLIARVEDQETELTKSRQLLTAVVDSTSNFIWSVDARSFGLQTYNEGLRAYFADTEGLQIAAGMRPEDMFPAERADRWHEFYQRALKEAPYTVEYSSSAGGLWLRLNFHLLQADGSVSGISVFAEDITERKAARDRMEQLVAEQGAILESELIGFLKTRNGTITWANRALAKMSGYGPGELVGMSTHQLHATEESDKAFGTAAYPVLSEGRIFRSQSEFLRKDGTPLWGEVSGTTFDRGTQEILWGVVDISERRRVERERQRLTRAMRLLSDCNLCLVQNDEEQKLYSHICNLVVDSGGYLMAWVGLAEQDADKSVRPVAQSGGASAYLDSIRISWDGHKETGRGPTGAAIRTATTQVNQNCLTNPTMGPWRESALRSGYQSSIAIPLVVQQQVVGVLTIYAAEAEAFSADEVELLEELGRNLAYGIQTLRSRLKGEAAEAATRAKSTFLATMSHEIRTPMNAIVGIAHLMRRDGVTPKQSLQLAKIDAAADHLLAIVNDVLDLSKIEAGKFVLEEADISIAGILDHVVSILSPKVSAKGLMLVMDTVHLPKYLRGDRTRLTQALLNLANNAVKFTGKGTITIRTRLLEETDDAKLLRFEVEDTGIGIAPEHLGRMFSAFEQAESYTTREYGGTGLGLVITKRLAQFMGGDVGVSSQPGVGSKFWFTARLKKASLTAVVPAEDDSGDAIEALLAGNQSGQRILLVEDEPTNQEVTVALLSDVGLVIDVAGNGQQAVEKVRRTEYDLILMDMQMPKMDGLKTTRQIRRMPGRGSLPILAMTANAFADDRQKCMTAGMNDFISKPVNPNKLYAVLLKWLPSGNSAGQRRQIAARPPAAAVAAPPGEGINSDECRRLLASVPGLDKERAMDLASTNTARYARWLSMFADAHWQDPPRMAEMMAAKDFAALKELAHALKGAASLVGAIPLSNAAAALESALRDGEEARFEPCCTTVIAELETLTAAIRATLTSP
jgi:PAS domain S-box-containing protein